LFGIGGYRLVIERNLNSPQGGGPGGLPPGLLAALQHDDLHTNDTLDQATDLKQKVFDTDPRCVYVYAASLSDERDVDFYRIRSPKAQAGAQNVLQVSLWGMGNDLDLRAAVFDALGQPVAAEVLVNDGKTFTLQIANALSNAHYF